MNAKSQLQNAIDAALQGVDISGVAPETLQVARATNPQFGDYQWNGALPLAKALKMKPRDIAADVLARLDVSDIAETPEIAGAGFLNFRIKTSWLGNALDEAARSERLGVARVAKSRRIVIDYPSPNVAKPLHVGHIRTTFIGDAVARLLRFAGHQVVSDNHIGDWGTPVGKVIVGWKKYRDEAAFERAPLDEMGRLYALVNEACERERAAMEEARLETAKLQSGDAENRAIWEILRAGSLPQLNALWARVGVQTDEILGESFYQPMLAEVIEELKAKGVATESQGALIIPFEDDAHLSDKPMMVRKSDGSALYATTDLATVKYRMERWAPDEIIYVVDARQSDHFRQLFAAAKKWGYREVRFKHVAFGTILGEDGKPISTRAGVTSKLETLLDEAQKRATAMAREKNPALPDAQGAEIGRVVGIGALKYADLAPNRTSDYGFSWDKMLATQGNAAPYLQYAYARIQSIFRKAQSEGIEMENAPIRLVEASEIALGKQITRFGEAIDAALVDYRPNALCDYLYELAGSFAAFYRDCPVTQAGAEVRLSRLALCDLTARVLQTGLGLLGIETLEQM